MRFFSKRLNGTPILAVLMLVILATACSPITPSNPSSTGHGTMSGDSVMGNGDFLSQVQVAGNSTSHSMIPTGQSTAPVISSQTTTQSDSHGHGVETPEAPNSDKGMILGGFGLVNGMVIAMAAVLKTQIPKKKRASEPVQAIKMGELK